MAVDVSEDAIYIGSKDSYYYALSITLKGKLKWKYQTDGPITSTSGKLVTCRICSDYLSKYLVGTTTFCNSSRDV